MLDCSKLNVEEAMGNTEQGSIENEGINESDQKSDDQDPNEFLNAGDENRDPRHSTMHENSMQNPIQPSCSSLSWPAPFILHNNMVSSLLLGKLSMGKALSGADQSINI